MIIIRKILYTINVFCALLLLLIYVAAFVPQDMFSYISLVGYAYPFVLVVNVVFVVLWLVWKPRNTILSLVAIAIGFDYVSRFVNFSSNDQTKKEITVLTYNVHDFVHNKDSENYLGEEVLGDSILNYIALTNADILCLQDYDVNITYKKGFHKYLLDSLGYHHFYYYHSHRDNVSNCAIYSKYPMTNTGSVLEKDTQNYLYIYADIKTPYSLLRVYNLHLASYMLGKDEQENYAQIIKGKVNEKQSKKIVSKLIDANRIRAKQIRSLLPEMEKQQRPVIICGDFNDHPFSNTYKKFSKIYTDSFVKRGSGIGSTYNGIFPAYRIDYVWYDKNRLECTSYSSPKMDFSDHYPILTTFVFKKE